MNASNLNDELTERFCCEICPRVSKKFDGACNCPDFEICWRAYINGMLDTTEAMQDDGR